MTSLVAGNSNDTIQSHLNVSLLSKNKSVASQQKPDPGKEVSSVDNAPSASTLVKISYAQNESSALGLYDRHGSVPIAAATNADGFKDSGLANSTHEGVKDSKNPAIIAQARLDVPQNIIDHRVIAEKETASIAEEKAARNAAQTLYTKQDTDAVKQQSVEVDATLSREAVIATKKDEPAFAAQGTAIKDQAEQFIAARALAEQVNQNYNQRQDAMAYSAAKNQETADTTAYQTTQQDTVIQASTQQNVEKADVAQQATTAATSQNIAAAVHGNAAERFFEHRAELRQEAQQAFIVNHVREQHQAQEADANRQTQQVDLAAAIAHIKVDRSSSVPSTAETKLLSAFLKT